MPRESSQPVFEALESRLLMSSGSVQPIWPLTQQPTSLIAGDGGCCNFPLGLPSPVPAPVGPFQSVPFVPLMNGSRAANLPLNLQWPLFGMGMAARNADELAALGIDVDQLPAIDFDRYMVVVVAQGAQSAPWNTLRVEGVVQTDGGLYVYSSVEPGVEPIHIPEQTACQIYAVIAVPKSDLPVYSMTTGLGAMPIDGPREMRGIEARAGHNRRVRAAAHVEDGITTTSASVILNGKRSVARNRESIISYSWSFDGEQIAVGKMPTVDLPVGRHEITLTVIDSRGRISTDTVIVNVLAPKGRKAVAAPVSASAIPFTELASGVALGAIRIGDAGIIERPRLHGDGLVVIRNRVQLEQLDAEVRDALPQVDFTKSMIVVMHMELTAGCTLVVNGVELTGEGIVVRTRGLDMRQPEYGYPCVMLTNFCAIAIPQSDEPVLGNFQGRQLIFQPA